MSLKERLESDLNDLVRCIFSIEEVIAVILFGSFARGDYDEYSDYDLLIVFKDKEAMWRRWDELFKRVGTLKMLVHCIPKSLDEFLNSDPTLLKEILQHGRLLYAKYPFQARMDSLNLKHMKVVSYNMGRLSQKEKMRLVYKLYGRKNSRNTGLLNELNGIKVSDGCMLVPAENYKRVVKALEEHGAKVIAFDVYLTEIAD